jgi:hypothetical protein
MDNSEKLATLGTQDTGRRQTKYRNVRENRRSNQEWTIQRNWQRWVHKTQDEGKQNIETLEKTEGAIKNGQFRETDNIGYIRHRTKTNKTNKR